MRKCEPSGSHFFYPAYLIELAADEKALLQSQSRPLTLHCGGQRVILAAISNHSSRTQWSFTLPTRRAPAQPARPIACSRSAKTSLAMGAPGNRGLALSSSVSGSAWQPPPSRPNHIPKKHAETCYLARAVGSMYDLLLGKGVLPCPSRNSR